MIYYGNELYHWGIKGQKWGERRYQYEDGTLTAEGRRRYGVGEARAKYKRAKDSYKKNKTPENKAKLKEAKAILKQAKKDDEKKYGHMPNPGESNYNYKAARYYTSKQYVKDQLKVSAGVAGAALVSGIIATGVSALLSSPKSKATISTGKNFIEKSSGYTIGPDGVINMRFKGE